MNGVDIAILVILAAILLKGLWRGLIRETCALIGLLLGAFLAFRFHALLAESLAQAFKFPLSICVIVSFLAIFLATVLVFAIFGHLLSQAVKLLFLGGFNRVAGGLFGLLEGGILLALVLFGISTTQLPGSFRRQLENSQLSPPFMQLGKATFDGSLRALDQKQAVPPEKTKL